MFYDTDCGGVVHNLAYLRMIEENRTKLAIELGMDLKTMAETQLFPVVVKIESEYKRAAKLGDPLMICGTLCEVERARFWCEFELTNRETGVLYVKSRQCLAMVQMPQGRPARLPQDLRERWG